LLIQKKCTHGEKALDPIVSIQSIHNTFLELELPPKTVENKGDLPMCTWHWPSGDTIKINVDGAINGQDTMDRSGGVVTNFQEDSVGRGANHTLELLIL
jgi:hypothetical protein